MARKPHETTDDPASATGGLFDTRLADAVRDSAHQIWLAGMGAFSKAQAEGSKVFEALVKEGASLQRKTQAVTEERMSEVGDRMAAMADGVSAKAGQHWDKLESIFEDRVSKALNRLGVPSAKDVATLISRIDALNTKVDRLAKGRPRSAAKSPQPTTPRKAGRRSGTE